ncbi:MAG TPA: pilus assembly protein PilP [Rhodocyclaceae bacterium]|jgi:type IV pilus assembly protein PilP|nr:pilus assembly protein PilP [Rhodocyclaceae bacterium]
MKAIAFFLVICSLLTACGTEEHGDIKQWMAEQSKDMKGGVKDPPPLVTPPIISYGSKDLESPFSPEKIRVKDGGLNDKSNPGAGRAPEYLEGFPLESLRLIGIISYRDKMFALIQTPEKPKHVTVGNYIGSNYGKISEITKTQVRVVELVKDANDVWVKREKILYLQQDDGGRK